MAEWQPLLSIQPADVGVHLQESFDASTLSLHPISWPRHDGSVRHIRRSPSALLEEYAWVAEDVAISEFIALRREGQPWHERLMALGYRIFGDRLVKWTNRIPPASQGFAGWMPNPPLWRPLWIGFVLVSYWIAGYFVQPGSVDTYGEFLKLARKIEASEKRGVSVVVALAGEFAEDEESAERMVQRYVNFAEFAGRRWRYSGFKRHVAIKLSGMHPQFDSQNPKHIDAVVQKVTRIGEAFKKAGLYMEIDGEFSTHRQAQRDITHRVQNNLDGWEGMGLAVQAYFQDSAQVLVEEIQYARTHRLRLGIRLVKGAYYLEEKAIPQDQRSVAAGVWETQDQVDAAYRKLTVLLLQNTHVIYPMIASMNPREQSWAMVTADYLNITHDRWAQHMLWGMQRNYQRHLIEAGSNVWDYWVVGSRANAIRYFGRRIAEIAGPNSITQKQYNPRIGVESLARYKFLIMAALGLALSHYLGYADELGLAAAAMIPPATDFRHRKRQVRSPRINQNSIATLQIHNLRHSVVGKLKDAVIQEELMLLQDVMDDMADEDIIEVLQILLLINPRKVPEKSAHLLLQILESVPVWLRDSNAYQDFLVRISELAMLNRYSESTTLRFAQALYARMRPDLNPITITHAEQQSISTLSGLLSRVARPPEEIVHYLIKHLSLWWTFRRIELGRGALADTMAMVDAANVDSQKYELYFRNLFLEMADSRNRPYFSHAQVVTWTAEVYARTLKDPKSVPWHTHDHPYEKRRWGRLLWLASLAYQGEYIPETLRGAFNRLPTAGSQQAAMIAVYLYYLGAWTEEQAIDKLDQLYMWEAPLDPGFYIAQEFHSGISVKDPQSAYIQMLIQLTQRVPANLDARKRLKVSTLFEDGGLEYQTLPSRSWEVQDEIWLLLEELARREKFDLLGHEAPDENWVHFNMNGKIQGKDVGQIPLLWAKKNAELARKLNLRPDTDGSKDYLLWGVRSPRKSKLGGYRTEVVGLLWSGGSTPEQRKAIEAYRRDLLRSLTIAYRTVTRLKHSRNAVSTWRDLMTGVPRMPYTQVGSNKPSDFATLLGAQFILSLLGQKGQTYLPYTERSWTMFDLLLRAFADLENYTIATLGDGGQRLSSSQKSMRYQRVAMIIKKLADEIRTRRLATFQIISAMHEYIVFPDPEKFGVPARFEIIRGGGLTPWERDILANRAAKAFLPLLRKSIPKDKNPRRLQAAA